MDASLNELVHSPSLKWCFVGGKGGVGKTTTSCCLAVLVVVSAFSHVAACTHHTLQMAAVRRNVLIVSTDPAHNLSDAFGQKFTSKPTLVSGFTNLYCMELDPSSQLQDSAVSAELDDAAGMGEAASAMSGMLKEFSSALPGIDEMMSFVELVKHIDKMEFDLTIFDTAPTGHTLRLLGMPAMLDKAISKLSSFRDRLDGIMSMVRPMLGAMAEGLSPEDLFAKLDGVKRQVDNVQKRLMNREETTFVCVCIPEFLSMYETERLVQELTKMEIDVSNIVVNQVLLADASDTSHCGRCEKRIRMQQGYLMQIAELYGDDFHVVTTPLLDEEVRGTEKLRAFSRFLARV